MDLKDVAAKLKAKKAQQDQANNKPYDFDESYRIRAKMLGVLLRDARESAARTIEDCARLLQITPEEFNAWEFGEDVPSLPQLELLAYYLDVPVSQFWSLETTRISRAGKETKQPHYISLRNRMIGAMLQQAREEQHISVEDLAETCGITAEAISSYESGEVPPPMHELNVLAGALGKNINDFVETTGQIGELLAMREAWKHFSSLPDDVREFASNPSNIGFIHIAVMFSQMPTDRLRQIAASLADITM